MISSLCDYRHCHTSTRHKPKCMPAGVVTYVRKPFSPVHAQAECIGGPDEEFANEGRCLHDIMPAHAQLVKPPADCVWVGRSVLTDHGSVVIINCYVPNAGGSKREGGRPRAQAKMRFLYLLQQKVDLLLQAGRQVCPTWLGC